MQRWQRTLYLVRANVTHYHPPPYFLHAPRSLLVANMLVDFEVQRCTRRCAATDRALEPGDECYSMLEVRGANIIRKDFCTQAWTPPRDGAFGWWKSRVPEPT